MAKIERSSLPKAAIAAMREGITEVRQLHDFDEDIVNAKSVAYVLATIVETEDGVSCSVLSLADFEAFPDLENADDLTPDKVDEFVIAMDNVRLADAIVRHSGNTVQKAISKVAKKVMERENMGKSIIRTLQELNQARSALAEKPETIEA